MSDTIEAGVGDDFAGLGSGEGGIKNRHLRGRFFVAACHFLVGLGIGDKGVGLHFTAGSGGGGHRDHGQHGFGRLAVSPVILHTSAVGEQEIAGPGRVE